jgi:exodeoxyribonuclease VII small subunit
LKLLFLYNVTGRTTHRAKRHTVARNPTRPGAIDANPLIPPVDCGSVRAMSQAPAPSSHPDPGRSDSQPDANRIAEFEHSLDELEQLVQRMEHGDLSLDESLKTYERGIALYRNCQSALEQAELRVKLLHDPEAPDDAQDFNPETP